MKGFVVDASIAFPWVIQTPTSTAARRILSLEFALHAPDFLYIEVASALWKASRFGGLPADKCDMALRGVRAVQIDVAESDLLIDRALKIALEAGRSVYDSLYLAVAEEAGYPLATADQRLYNALQSTRFAKQVVWVEDLPEP